MANKKKAGTKKAAPKKANRASPKRSTARDVPAGAETKTVHMRFGGISYNKNKINLGAKILKSQGQTTDEIERLLMNSKLKIEVCKPGDIPGQAILPGITDEDLDPITFEAECGGKFSTASDGWSMSLQIDHGGIEMDEFANEYCFKTAATVVTRLKERETKKKKQKTDVEGQTHIGGDNMENAKDPDDDISPEAPGAD